MRRKNAAHLPRNPATPLCSMFSWSMALFMDNIYTYVTSSYHHHHLQVNDSGGVLDPLTAQQSFDHIDQLRLNSDVDHCLVETHLVVVVITDVAPGW